MKRPPKRPPSRRRYGERCQWWLLVFVLTAPAALAQAADPSADSRLPTPVKQFIERSENCLHFAGEFGGDGSPRDAEVNREMDRLHCNALPADLQTLRKRYRSDAAVTARLTAFDNDGMPVDSGAGD